MIIKTYRLTLRHFRTEDFEDWYPLDQDERVMRYIWQCKPKPLSREEAQRRLNYMIAYYSKFPGLGVFATCLNDTGELIGWTSLKDLDGSEHIEIGYRYFYEYWGRGYATEAASALRDHGFEEVGLENITAVTHPDNEASKRVLEKMGFQYIREDVFYDTDVHFFEQHRDWKKRSEVG